MSPLDAKSAGAKARNNVVSREIAAEKTSTLVLMAMGLKRGRSLGIRDSNHVIPHEANTMPAAPPNMAMGKLSRSNWVSKRPRPAPMAERTANSCCRAVARASIKFAIFTQAINKTNDRSQQDQQS